MTTSMGPPPPKDPNTTITSSATTATDPEAKISDESSPSCSVAPTKTSMGPPPPKNPNPPQPDSVQLKNNVLHEEPRSSPPHTHSNPTDNANGTGNSETTGDSSLGDEKKEQRPNFAVPYTIPPWSGPPCHHYNLEVLKDGAIIGQFDVSEKGPYMFGRVDLCDFVLEHPTISRFHAVLQFKSSGDAYLYDLGSTHGTFINKNEVKKRVYVELHVGDVIRFGHSSRLYIFQGPAELMPPERDLKIIRKAKMREEMQDMEASLLRAKLEASLADGISWGMRDDAIEENEDDIDEITWQTYKGQLTEKQEKTREKVLKRLEKIAHMKKEIDAIRAKDIAQGGLTQGQQTQVARNEQRISQLMEELENLEETLNESIRESIGARTKRLSRDGKKGAEEDDEEEYLSDDDEFYDRTKKPSKQKGVENQYIETADSLLDKKDAAIKEIEGKRKLLLDEENKMSSQSEVEAGDTLDAYMSGLSSQLVVDKRDQLQKELSNLQSELDRVMYLLKIADPTGEAARKRKAKVQEPKLDVPKIPPSTRQFPLEQNKEQGVEQTEIETVQKPCTSDATVESSKKTQEQNVVGNATDSKGIRYTVVKPQWLGAVEDKETKESRQEEPSTSVQESDQFVDYKDRNKILEKASTAQANVDSEIENAAPGLIIRKRKQVEESKASEVKGSQSSASVGTGTRAEDAIALLLKHSKGYYVSDDGMDRDGENMPPENQSGRENKKPKRVLGPERPSFLGTESDYESWVPPEGQSGDGWTFLNDRYGY